MLNFFRETYAWSQKAFLTISALLVQQFRRIRWKTKKPSNFQFLDNLGAAIWSQHIQSILSRYRKYRNQCYAYTLSEYTNISKIALTTSRYNQKKFGSSLTIRDETKRVNTKFEENRNLGNVSLIQKLHCVSSVWRDAGEKKENFPLCGLEIL